MTTKILMTGDHKERLLPLADQLTHSGIPSSANIIYSERNVLGVDNGLCIKSFKRLGCLKGFIYGNFRVPKAERAYFAAVRLRQMGIDTPQPRLLVVNHKHGRVTTSFYVCDYYDGWETLRGAEKRQDFNALAADLAAFMKLIHSKGVQFRDFSQGNVLFRKREDGTFQFAMVDINRIRFGVTNHAKLLSDFGKVLDTREGMVILAREYAKGTPYSPEELVDIYDRTQKRLFRKKHFKNFFRKNKK